MKPLALALVVACGSGGDRPKDAGPGDDGTVAVDAPELPPCPNPVAGSTIQARRIGVVVGAALLATSPPRDPRLFVLEQRGAIRIFRDESWSPGCSSICPPPAAARSPRRASCT